MKIYREGDRVIKPSSVNIQAISNQVKLPIRCKTRGQGPYIGLQSNRTVGKRHIILRDFNKLHILHLAWVVLNSNSRALTSHPQGPESL